MTLYLTDVDTLGDLIGAASLTMTLGTQIVKLKQHTKAYDLKEQGVTRANDSVPQPKKAKKKHTNPPTVELAAVFSGILRICISLACLRPDVWYSIVIV